MNQLIYTYRLRRLFSRWTWKLFDIYCYLLLETFIPTKLLAVLPTALSDNETHFLWELLCHEVFLTMFDMWQFTWERLSLQIHVTVSSGVALQQQKPTKYTLKTKRFIGLELEFSPWICMSYHRGGKTQMWSFKSSQLAPTTLPGPHPSLTLLHTENVFLWVECIL